MRLLLSFLSALFLLTSCALHEYNKTLTELHGAHIDQAIALLGQPTSKDGNAFVWSKSRQEQQGGYYYTRHETRYRTGRKGETITELIPKREWVPPYEAHLWCQTIILVSPEGVILDHTADGNDCP
jgi:hypothetical protein